MRWTAGSLKNTLLLRVPPQPDLSIIELPKKNKNMCKKSLWVGWKLVLLARQTTIKITTKKNQRALKEIKSQHKKTF